MSPKSHFWIKTMVLVIIILLSASIYYKRVENTCNNCRISFIESTSQRGENILDVPVKDIYQSYLNGSCLVKKTEGGYFYSGLYKG